MLKDAAVTADSITISEEYGAWSLFGDGCNNQVVKDIYSCREMWLVSS